MKIFVDNPLAQQYDKENFIIETVEAEIKVMMLLQRTRLLRTGGKQVIKWTAEGAVNDVISLLCNIQYSAT